MRYRARRAVPEAQEGPVDLLHHHALEARFLRQDPGPRVYQGCPADPWDPPDLWRPADPAGPEDQEARHSREDREDPEVSQASRGAPH